MQIRLIIFLSDQKRSLRFIDQNLILMYKKEFKCREENEDKILVPETGSMC